MDAPARAARKGPWTLAALTLALTSATTVAALGAPPLDGAATTAAAPEGRPPRSHPVDVLTYHNDNLRTGWNDQETELTVATVGSKRFGRLATLDVDGDVLAQPLLVTGLRMPDRKTHDVLLVVTENDSVYAFDFATFRRLWHVSLGTPQKSSDVGCPHVHPLYGISATPVIVRQGPGQATVYLVSAAEPKAGVFNTKLHALDLANGRPVKHAVQIQARLKLEDGSTVEYSPRYQWFRAGLAYRDGSVYLSASSHCDIAAGSISGWMLRYDRDLKQTARFSTIRTKASYQLAAIWASGFAPAIDRDGSLFVVTGNGNYSKGTDWGESVLRLPPDLRRAEDFFTPDDYANLNAEDMDFGSGGVMLIPGRGDPQQSPPLAVAMGKADVLYLLDRSKLGHRHADDSGALQALQLGPLGHGVWGGPCYWQRDRQGQGQGQDSDPGQGQGHRAGLVYYQTSDDVLRAYALDDGAHPSLTEVARGTSDSFAGSLPVGSSNGTREGTGVVWTVNRSSVALEAYDAEHLGAPIFSAALPPWTAGSPFLTPMQADGRVVVGSSKAVVIFGLKD